jgi:hypothetical protein
MTVVKTLSTALFVLRESAQDPAAAPGKQPGRYVIPAATVVFLATAAVMLSIDWRVGVPAMVALSIAGVVVAERRISGEPIVDDEEFAFDRFEATDESTPSPLPPVVDAARSSLVELASPVVASIARARRALAPAIRK